MSKLTQEKLKELLDYNPHNGDFIWIKRGKGRPTGKIAGTKDALGYQTIGISGKTYKAHRLAWLYMEGYFPNNIDIDHIDHNPANNKFKNLRLASRQCNMRNSCSNNKNNIKGVSWIPKAKRWRVNIGINIKTIYLGSFIDFDEAVCLRLAAEQCLSWSGCDSSSPAYKYVKNMLKG